MIGAHGSHESLQELLDLTRQVRAADKAARELRIELRKLLAKYSLPPAGELFEKAYAYVAENH